MHVSRVVNFYIDTIIILRYKWVFVAFNLLGLSKAINILILRINYIIDINI